MLASALIVSFTPQPSRLFSGADGDGLAHCDGFLSRPRLIPVPPTVMLHSREGASRQWQFACFLDELLARGFTVITYREWRKMVLADTLPAKPAIVTIDDVTALDNQQAWSVFQQMQRALSERGLPGVFALNTYSDRPHKEDSWDIMAEWVRQGAELASHTDTHPILNNLYSGPNTLLCQVDYCKEITRSAEYIEYMMSLRGLAYQTETLITPYGHGYDYHAGAIHTEIVNACRDCHIRQVVGIGLGRRPFTVQDLLSCQPVYMGRSGPKEVESQPYTTAVTVEILERWHRNNQHLLQQFAAGLPYWPPRYCPI